MRPPLGNARGFTLIELMIVLGITLFVMAAASRVMVALIMNFRQQSKIAETSVESIIGLRIMQADIQSAGSGIPWDFDGTTINYTDVLTATEDNQVPKALLMDDNLGINGSDRLIIKSMAIGSRDMTSGLYAAAGKWHSLVLNQNSNEVLNHWMDSSGDADDNLAPSDSVIVLALDRDGSDFNIKLVSGALGDWFADFSIINSGGSDYVPTSRETIHIVYGVTNSTDPDMPFNQGIYLIDNSPSLVPSRCAPGTGVLVKQVYNHESDGMDPSLPLLDCVADMQVIFAQDGDADGVFDEGDSDDQYVDSFTLAGLNTAKKIREQIAEVRVFILTHDGQYDPNFNFKDMITPISNTTLPVGDSVRGLGHVGAGEFNVGALANGTHYRWRVHRVTETPTSLRMK